MRALFFLLGSAAASIWDTLPSEDLPDERELLITESVARDEWFGAVPVDELQLPSGPFVSFVEQTFPFDGVDSVEQVGGRSESEPQEVFGLIVKGKPKSYRGPLQNPLDFTPLSFLQYLFGLEDSSANKIPCPDIDSCVVFEVLGEGRKFRNSFRLHNGDLESTNLFCRAFIHAKEAKGIDDDCDGINDDDLSAECECEMELVDGFFAEKYPNPIGFQVGRYVVEFDPTTADAEDPTNQTRLNIIGSDGVLLHKRNKLRGDRRMGAARVIGLFDSTSKK